MAGDDGTRAGIGDALAELAADRVAAEPVQLALLPSKFEPGSEQHVSAIAQVRRNLPGRPPGAKNRITRDTLDLVRRLFGDPVVERARWLLHSPQTLARELGCTTIEAFDRQDAIRADLQRLFYAPLAPVDGNGVPVAPVFSMQIGMRGQADDPRPPWERHEQNQGLIDVSPNVSHGAKSHEDDK